MIRIDEIWLATEPLDMRAGPDTALASVVAVFGAAKPHCAYPFANRRANRMKVLVHDGMGVWLAAPPSSGQVQMARDVARCAGGTAPGPATRPGAGATLASHND